MSQLKIVEDNLFVFVLNFSDTVVDLYEVLKVYNQYAFLSDDFFPDIYENLCVNAYNARNMEDLRI
ncbi:hypothetical protein 2AV2_41 [Nodularia phage vB_NpeS-2AV2]|jgi:hypothetical protein|uniref:Uncharacterized protein n=3 Tax=Ravarandavirus TaxID=2843444 RepID=A0A482MK05_9CAUD|nr:hypothetical protein HWA92_gp041 [Nodularia phage vB_NpeS-2AV2]YP_009844856.1 hypothetical protein HWC13_gp047 [Nodularia phage vB_NspS-kac68v161]ALY07493.1 hypothetical protein 2AV2_41 [Nodularia phage vB_NpeS-2AV2]QBQ73697.1 hypothetical protein kac68v161_gp047 [Nodularia phage vB_NspS-kac68v161]QBQ73895.1 hypothetical protein kac68v162_gp047 [Nodularia phage vB_NspS-kac68v162]